MLVTVHDPSPRCGTRDLRATVRALIELAGLFVNVLLVSGTDLHHVCRRSHS